MKKYQDVISSAPLFKDINIGRIKELLTEGNVLKICLKKGDSITDLDEFHNALALVLSGSLEVAKNHDDHRVILNILYPGHLFGMATLFYGDNRDISQIKAGEKTDVLILPKEWVETAMAIEPKLVKNYIEILSQRIYFLNEKIDEYTAADSRTTLLRYMESQANHEGIINIATSMTKLAVSLNISRPSLYRAIKKLEEDSIITTIDKKTFRLNNYS